MSKEFTNWTHSRKLLLPKFSIRQPRKDSTSNKPNKVPENPEEAYIESAAPPPEDYSQYLYQPERQSEYIWSTEEQE